MAINGREYPLLDSAVLFDPRVPPISGMDDDRLACFAHIPIPHCPPNVLVYKVEVCEIAAIERQTKRLGQNMYLLGMA